MGSALGQSSLIVTSNVLRCGGGVEKKIPHTLTYHLGEALNIECLSQVDPEHKVANTKPPRTQTLKFRGYPEPLPMVSIVVPFMV